MVTFDAIEVAVEGITQSPFEPVAVNLTVSPAVRGVPREPTIDSARVSTRRHGTMETNDEAGLLPAKTA
jgi:hypothetical protein